MVVMFFFYILRGKWELSADDRLMHARRWPLSCVIKTHLSARPLPFRYNCLSEFSFEFLLLLLSLIHLQPFKSQSTTSKTKNQYDFKKYQLPAHSFTWWHNASRYANLVERDDRWSQDGHVRWNPYCVFAVTTTKEILRPLILIIKVSSYPRSLICETAASSSYKLNSDAVWQRFLFVEKKIKLFYGIRPSEVSYY